MHNITLVNFIDLSLDEQKLILQWRNSIDVRKWMYTQDTISIESHLKYIQSLETKEDRLYFLVKKKNDLIGVIDFTTIDKINNCAEIGLYSNPSIKGVGIILMNSIINYGFEELHLDTLLANVLKTNVKAIKLYKKYNFITHKEDMNLLYMELKNEDR